MMWTFWITHDHAAICRCNVKSDIQDKRNWKPATSENSGASGVQSSKLKWMNKETLEPRDHFLIPFFRKSQIHPTQASGPADLMLSDMTFTSYPAPWKAPWVLSLSHVPLHHAVRLEVSLLWSSIYCHHLRTTHKYNYLARQVQWSIIK